jgi:hypothetical protein
VNWDSLDAPIIPVWPLALAAFACILLAVGRAVRQTRRVSYLDRPVAGPPFNGRTPREWDAAQRQGRECLRRNFEAGTLRWSGVIKPRVERVEFTKMCDGLLCGNRLEVGVTVRASCDAERAEVIAASNYFKPEKPTV